jgi:hypothetical protein
MRWSALAIGPVLLAGCNSILAVFIAAGGGHYQSYRLPT